VFLDRDGTIIRDVGYLRDPSEVTLLPGSVEALSMMSAAGFMLILASNQSGIGRGLITQEQADRVHRRFEELLDGEGVRLSASYYCPHHPDDNCQCRKPRTGLLERASMELDIDLRTSVMVGDSESDADAGAASGCRAILIDPTGIGCPRACCTVPDLASAAELVLKGWE
ncbi:uncharacterized protein METZ01_LOCUS87912, partial [marine metagenome]